MAIIEPIIRPPSEAMSFLLQITTGCSGNLCNFCGAYKNKPFSIKAIDEVFSDIDQGVCSYPDVRRVFLMDGDALAIKNEQLLPLLKKLNLSFLKLSRISSYANGYNITNRSDGELRELYENKLKLIYIGLESGSQKILDICRKTSTVNQMIDGVKRAMANKIKSSVIVLLGLGGKKYSKEHVENTAKALNVMQPRFLSFLSLMLIPNTDLYKKAKRGEFLELNPKELLIEAYQIIKGLELKKTIFRSDHASNYLSLEGRFPQDKARLLDNLDLAIKGDLSLRPEFLRGL